MARYELCTMSANVIVDRYDPYQKKTSKWDAVKEFRKRGFHGRYLLLIITGTRMIGKYVKL